MGNRGPTIRVITVARKGKKPAGVLPENFGSAARVTFYLDGQRAAR